MHNTTHTVTKRSRALSGFIPAAVIAAVMTFGQVSTAFAGLIGLYTFDGNTNDSSGNGNNPTSGTVSGYTGGVDGQAAIFNGSFDKLILPIDISPAYMSGLTMGAWVSTNAFSGRRAIISADDNSPANYDRQIGIDDRASSVGSAYSAFGGGSTGVVNSSIPLTSAFTFVAARYDGTTVKLWVNGSTFTAADTTPGDAIENPTLWIGKNPNFDSYFSGKIDNVFVFDQALTDTQVDSIRTGGVTGILDVAAVPEPGTSLFGIACAGIAAIRRRRRAQAA